MKKETNGCGPTEFVCFKLNRAVRNIKRYYESKLASHDITASQFYVLNTLWENDGAKFKDLAKCANIDGSTLTGILDRMEHSGLVERRDDPDDRRSLLIFLTEKAKKEGPELINIAKKFDREVKEKFSREDFEIFLKVLDQLSKQIE
ncbi:MAG TPA: MarR family transcriptional regulator [Bacillota bacterium]|nr:MarR family transcriptional regulator [Bacillota bacterium]